MTMHFPIVPVNAGPYQALLQEHEALRPLVLVVDDEPIITETLSAILNSVGFAAIPAFCGRSALEIAHLIPPQVLITDLAMPGLDGLDLGVAVTRAVPDCEVILFSGHASVSELVGRMHAMHCDFETLLKPVHPADMIDKVCECLERRGCHLAPAKSHRKPSFEDLIMPGRRHDEIQTPSWSFHLRQRTRSSTATA